MNPLPPVTSTRGVSVTAADMRDFSGRGSSGRPGSVCAGQPAGQPSKRVNGETEQQGEGAGEQNRETWRTRDREFGARVCVRAGLGGGRGRRTWLTIEREDCGGAGDDGVLFRPAARVASRPRDAGAEKREEMRRKGTWDWCKNDGGGRRRRATICRGGGLDFGRTTGSNINDSRFLRCGPDAGADRGMSEEPSEGATWCVNTAPGGEPKVPDRGVW